MSKTLAVAGLVLMAACTGGGSGHDVAPTTIPTKTAPPLTSSTTTLPPPPPAGQINFADCVTGYHNPPGRTDICVPNS